MDDPWDVKNVRDGNLYVSCMKINGVPLLPPVLSKESRKEMQYYKLLAMEVEKRISTLKARVESDSVTYADTTETPDSPDTMEYDDSQCALRKEKVEETIDYILDEISLNGKNGKSSFQSPKTDKYKNHSQDNDLNLIIDIDTDVTEGKYSTAQSPRASPIPVEIPVRDSDSHNHKKSKKHERVLSDSVRKRIHKNPVGSIMDDIDFCLNTDDFESLQQDGPSSLSSKSFTGSLNDIHTDTSKQSHESKLIRQRSYTVLNPSPQLIAHLEVQSMSTGMDLKSISMSESTSQLDYSTGKKRKSWDLQSAKVKWSSMAMELRRKNIVMKANSVSNKVQLKNTRSICLTQDRQKCNTNTGELRPEPNKKSKNPQSSVTNSPKRSSLNQIISTSTSKTEKLVSPTKEDNKDSTIPLVSKSDDPAGRVKEFYEKLQKQQLMQMASLMEKQKREQQILQQVFQEQNNILIKQLKNVCPKISIEVKQAWGDLKEDNDRGPVSLSQLINTSSPDHSIPNSPVDKTLTESNSCISKCDYMLQRSRDITNSFRQTGQQSNGAHSRKSLNQAPSNQVNGDKKSKSPTRNTSRKLKYDTTASSDADTLYTDQTNDTMADLNVTFPSDDEPRTPRLGCSNRASSPLSPRPDISKKPKQDKTDGVKILGNTPRSRKPVGSCSHSVTRQSIVNRQPNAKELVAASRIVACAKGYLVRRLMRTERVQATVQTIRDALLCALQLHQDRDGIRGADVDLHRRLIQQITAACYTIHDTFVTSTPAERCSIIAADRTRRQVLATKQSPSPRRSLREKNVSRTREQYMTHSVNYDDSDQETYTTEMPRSRCSMPRRRRVPWR